MKKHLVMNRNLKDVMSDIERDLMFEIVLSLRHGKLSVERAQKLAHDFLEIMNVKTKKELFSELRTLAISYMQAHEVYMKYKKAYIEEVKVSTIKRASYHIRMNNIEKAVHIVKGGISV